ncbi:alkene reductase [Staphylococcus sp. AS1337]|uniref:alkene reductase n=1 Tax=Staphylococcus sp. AS1337 TaxID=3434042 RepID=UPI003F56A238
MNNLWNSIQIGEMTLNHRLALSPMTRSRAYNDGVPNKSAAKYYSQRASLGLLITEGTQPSDDGQGYMNSPGIYNQAHIDGWKKVTDAVHKENAYLFIQLMHTGRIAHPDNSIHHRQPVAPSAVKPDVEMHTAEGKKPIPTPRELSNSEIKAIVDEFRHAAASAIAAGADGIEIHGANGYLVHQFLGDNTNLRKDEYGGSIENRARFAIEVTKAIVDEIGASKTGFRISPNVPLGDIDEGDNGEDLYRYFVKELDKMGLAYLHVMHTGNESLLKDIRKIWSNPLLVNRGGRSVNEISRDIDEGLADVAPLGTFALANPDIVKRLQKGLPLNDPNPQKFYGGNEEGYTDYPFIEE